MQWTKSELKAYTPNHPGTVLVLQGEISEDKRWFVSQMGDPARPSWAVSCPKTGARIASFDRKWHARAFCVEMSRRLEARKPATVYGYVCDEMRDHMLTAIERKAARLNEAGIGDVLREYEAHTLRRKPAPAWLTR